MLQGTDSCNDEPASGSACQLRHLHRLLDSSQVFDWMTALIRKLKGPGSGQGPTALRPSMHRY